MGSTVAVKSISGPMPSNGDESETVIYCKHCQMPVVNTPYGKQRHIERRNWNSKCAEAMGKATEGIKRYEANKGYYV